MASLDWDTIAILVALGCFPVSLVLTRFFMYWNSSHGIVGTDVHKLSKPRVPEMCGAAVPITLIIFGVIYCLVAGASWVPFTAYSLVVGLTALVGAVDDRLKMRGIFKPLLTLFCGLPLLVLGLEFPGQVYNSTLRVPLFGGYHLPIIYPLTILIVISVTSNAVNMLDPLNGSMSGGISIVAGGLLIGCLLTSASSTTIFLYASLLFTLLGFFYYNKFPSRAFSGNVGQLSIGASLGALAILGRTEIASIVAMFPNIQNSFFFMSRIRRFTEHRELKARPTKLTEDGKIASSEDPAAPLTLVRTLVVEGPKTEPDIVSDIWGLFLASTTLAVITLYLMGIVL
jgi:UDP-GlcNAc:undecaprenyl-phosphate/decaprenyl-phosphate GlcNAc-1-phosphate transferase